MKKAVPIAWNGFFYLFNARPIYSAKKNTPQYFY